MEGYIRTRVQRPYVLIVDSLFDISPVPLTAVGLLRQWGSEKDSLGHEMLHCYVTEYSIGKDLSTYVDRLLNYYVDQGTKDKTGTRRRTRILSKKIWDNIIDIRVRKGYSTSELARLLEIPETTLAARIVRAGKANNQKGKSVNMFDPDIINLKNKIRQEYEKWYGYAEIFPDANHA